MIQPPETSQRRGRGSWRGMAVAGALALVLAACSATHPSSSSYREELGGITVAVDTSRIGQLYSQKLNLLLNRHHRSGDLYELDVSLNSTESDDAVTMSARIGLYDRSLGKTVTTKSLSSSASIGAVASLYGSEEAKRHARERLAGHLAEKSYQFLLLHFSRNTEAN